MMTEGLSLLAEEFKSQLSENQTDLDSIKLPYIIKEHILMSPGTWNGYIYTKDALTEALQNTEWSKTVRSLFWEHEDKSAKDWVGEIKNPKLKNGNIVGDIVIVDKPLAIKLAYGAKFGVSPKIEGYADYDKKIQKPIFKNFSIVINPAVKTTFLNSEIKNMEEKYMEGNLEELKKTISGLAEDFKSLKEELTKKQEVKNEEEEENNLAKEIETLKEQVEELKKKKEEDKKKKYPEPYKKEEKYPQPAMSEDEKQFTLASGELFKKAKEIKAKYPDMNWKDCIKKAATLSEEDEKEPEEKKEETKQPEKKEEEKVADKMSEKKDLKLSEDLKQITSELKEKDPIFGILSNGPTNADLGMANYLKEITKKRI